MIRSDKLTFPGFHVAKVCPIPIGEHSMNATYAQLAIDTKMVHFRLRSSIEKIPTTLLP